MVQVYRNEFLPWNKGHCDVRIRFGKVSTMLFDNKKIKNKDQEQNKILIVDVKNKVISIIYHSKYRVIIIIVPRLNEKQINYNQLE